jgi:hypothetical protein
MIFFIVFQWTSNRSSSLSKSLINHFVEISLRFQRSDHGHGPTSVILLTSRAISAWAMTTMEQTHVAFKLRPKGLLSWPDVLQASAPLAALI